jgi:glycosyltransferase involved in cell wall biosynthesis
MDRLNISSIEPCTKVQTEKISVIIPAFNEERFLSKTIAAVKRNDFPMNNCQIIVVNNGSTDRTSEIARNSDVEVIECVRMFVGAARNLGVQKARGEYLAFLDADCIPQTDWLREGIRSLEVEPCVTGAVYGLPEDAGWIEKTWFSQKK